jgi:hypothetical protein
MTWKRATSPALLLARRVLGAVACLGLSSWERRRAWQNVKEKIPQGGGGE